MGKQRERGSRARERGFFIFNVDELHHTRDWWRIYRVVVWYIILFYPNYFPIDSGLIYYFILST